MFYQVPAKEITATTIATFLDNHDDANEQAYLRTADQHAIALLERGVFPILNVDRGDLYDAIDEITRTVDGVPKDEEDAGANFHACFNLGLALGLRIGAAHPTTQKTRRRPISRPATGGAR